MKFVADTMLEKLARWLRLIGNDVVYDSSKSFKELVNISNSEERVFLTRRKSFPEGISPIIFYDVCSENFDVQMKRVITQFGLDINATLFTRCIECNVEVEKVKNKETVNGRVPQRSLEGFTDFFECPKCKKVFWKGAHTTNTLKKLSRILDGKI